MNFLKKVYLFRKIMDYYKDKCSSSEANNQSRKFFSEDLKATEKVSNDQRILRRDVLRKRLTGLRFKAGNNNNNARRSALQIFPEELWAAIFQYVTNENDILNCGRTCTLFNTILKEEWTTILFKKTFPLICQTLSKTDILSCRIVCRKWCSVIDTFLFESFHEIEVNPRNPEEPYTGSQQDMYNIYSKFYYCFKIPPEAPLTGNDLSRDDMKLHPRNPFIGKSVLLHLNSAEHDYDMDTEQNLEQFLNDFGNHLGNINICGGVDIPISIGTWKYYAMCCQILVKCPPLKSLSLDYISVNWPHSDLSQNISLHFNPPLPPHPFLQVLQISYHGKSILPIQDALLVKYSDQLKKLEVYFWNNYLYHDLPWKNLSKLTISQRNYLNWMPSLIKMEAPNLSQLDFAVDGPIFGLLMIVLEHFKNVEKLTWDSRDFGLSAKDTTTRGMLCSGSVTCLELRFPSAMKDLDFLVHFPCLKRLDITFSGNLGKISRKEVDLSGVGISFWINEQDDGQARKRIYESKLWQILSCLEVLKIKKCATVTYPDRIRVYCRRGYEQFCKSLV